MTSIDHLHQESLTLKVRDHSDMLSAQYLVNCLEDDHVCHGIRTQEPRSGPIKETLQPRHHLTVLPNPAQVRKKAYRTSNTRGRFGHSAQRKQTTKRPPTTNSTRGTESEPEITMHSVTTTIRKLPSTAGLQTQDVRRTKRHLYRLWSFATGRETPVQLQRTPDRLDTCASMAEYSGFNL